MTTIELLWIYIITSQVMWLITFIVWAIDPLKRIREPFLLISFLLITPPVTIFMVISWLIGKLADKLNQKKEEEAPDTHEVRQDDETGLVLYSTSDYKVGDLVYADDKYFRILSMSEPKNGVNGYHVKEVNADGTEKTK